LGGLCFIIGWIALAIAIVNGKTSKGKSND
jgi:uncharacterized membrane protein YgdD (TMEM256/DUF423 family)